VWDEIANLGVPAVVTVLPDRLAELADVLPGLGPVPIALDHCGFVEYSAGIPATLAALAPFTNLHLKVTSNALDLMAAHGDPADIVAELASVFGGRLMWGSDYSQTHDRPYPELVEWGRSGAAKLSEVDRGAYLGGNALRMWPELAR
jgi:predicted TIM-barrel fold metal-dependent hydrolase